MSRTKGVLPSQTLKQIIKAGFITGIPEDYVNPSSLDLPLGQEAYRLEGVFILKPGETVRSLLPAVGATPHDLRSPLEVGVSYLISLQGYIELPPEIYAYANPKSSTGRNNLFCRIVADGVGMYDALTPAGWRGEAWVLVRADSFPVLVHPGLALSQVRLFGGSAFLDPLEIDCAVHERGLLFHKDGRPYQLSEYRRHADSIFLPLAEGDGIVGWECRGSSRVLDFNKKKHYRPEDFFVPVVMRSGSLTLHKGGFYILSTVPLRVPPAFAAELRAMDPRFGEFSSHKAGFIDTGWGCGKDGEACGRPITLEMLMYETRLVRAGDSVSRIRYEHMREVSEVSYDAADSNYTHQATAMLSKHFKQ